MSTSRTHNIPDPWKTRKWPIDADIGRLASAVGNILVSGPTNTQYPQGLYGSHAIDRAERLARRDRVSPYKSRRLASMSQGNPEMATLAAGIRYPTGRQKASRPLYTQFLEQRAKGPVLWAIIWDLLGLGEGSAMRGR